MLSQTLAPAATRRSDRQAARQNAAARANPTMPPTHAAALQQAAAPLIPPPTTAQQGMDLNMAPEDQPQNQLLPAGTVNPPNGAPAPPADPPLPTHEVPLAQEPNMATLVESLIANIRHSSRPLNTPAPPLTLTDTLTAILARSGAQDTTALVAPPTVTTLALPVGVAPATLPPAAPAPNMIPAASPTPDTQPVATPSLAALFAAASPSGDFGITELRQLLTQLLGMPELLHAANRLHQSHLGENPNLAPRTQPLPQEVIVVDDSPASQGHQSYSPPSRTLASVQQFHAALARMHFNGENLTSKEDLAAWMDKLNMMVEEFGYAQGREYSRCLHHAFTGAALSWLMSVLPTYPLWTPPLFKQSFMARWAGQVRDPRAEALSLLVQRRIIMETNESVESYSERFLSVSRKVPDITGAALCQLYIAGLNDILRPRCVLTNSNTEWDSLPDLMRHSFAENLRNTLSANSGSVFTPQLPTPITNPLPTVTQTLLNPNQRWGKNLRVAVLSHLQSSLPQLGLDDAEITEADGGGSFTPVASSKRPRSQLTPATPSFTSCLTASRAPSRAQSPPPPPQRSGGSYAAVAAITASVPTGPDPEALPRFCNYNKVSHADIQVGFMKSPGASADEPGLPIWYHPPHMTDAQLRALPGFGTEGRNRGIKGSPGYVEGIKLASIPNAKKALEDAGVCTICRRGRHPPVFCPHRKQTADPN